MKIATWNVNSIKVRIPHLMEWVAQADPDVVLLQELKTTEDLFPRMAIDELGYNMAVVGQKTYNGVAILSKRPIEVASPLCGSRDRKRSDRLNLFTQW
jgi:exodeoxyribonuclease-3